MANGYITADKSSLYFGQTVTFTAHFFEFENKVTATYSYNGQTDTIFTEATLDGSTYTWTVPATLATYYSSSATCTVTADFYAGSTKTGSSTITLNLLPYSSSVVKWTAGASSAYIGTTNAVQFSISKYGALTSVTLNYTFVGSPQATGTIVTKTTGSSVSWTPQSSLASTNCANATSGQLTITATCFVDSTPVKTETLGPSTLYVPDSAVPTASIAVSEATSGLAAKFGFYVQNKSTLRVVTTASGALGSTIKSYLVNINGKNYSGSTVTTDALSYSGSKTLTVTVTDSRGRTKTVTQSINVTAYSAPSITAFSAWRADSSGTADSTGEYVRINATAAITSLSSKNDKSFVVQYKVTNSGSFADASSWTSAYSLSQSNYAIGRPEGGYSNLTSYYIRLLVTDYFGSVEKIVTIPTQKVMLDFNDSGTGLGIGMINQNASAIDSAWTYNGTNVSLSGQVEASGDGEKWPIVQKDSSGNLRIQMGVYSAYNSLWLRQWVSSSVYENYSLPAPSAASSSWYNILTSKNAVTVPQGGTGATTASAALTNLGAVAKAGDTMTGRLTTQITTWDNATAPSAARSYDTHYVTDANDRSMSFQRIHHGADNVIGVEYGIRRQISDSSTLWNTLRLNVAADGTRTVNLTDPAAWRSALGLGSMATESASDYLPLTGGTLTGSLTGTYITSKNYYQTHTDGSVYVLNARNADGSKHRGMMNLSTTNNWWWTEYTTSGGSATESYGLPAPTRTASGNSGYTIATTKFLQTGTVAASSVSANGYKSGTITFATPYATAPTVIVSLYGGGDSVSAFGNVSVRVKALGASGGNTTGFTYEIDNASSASRNIGMMWIAFAAS